MPDASPIRDEENPYAAPASETSPGPEVDATDDDRAVRLKYLDTESTAKTIGLIQLLGCGFSAVTSMVWVFGSDAYLTTLMKDAPPGVTIATLRISAIIAGGIGVAFGVVFGLGLRTLRNWARILTMIFIVLGFVGGLFTLISAVSAGNSLLASAVAFAPLALFLYFAIFLGKPETRFVYSPEFKAAASRTPAIVPSMGTRDWVLLGLYIALTATSLVFQYRKIA